MSFFIWSLSCFFIFTNHFLGDVLKFYFMQENWTVTLNHKSISPLSKLQTKQTKQSADKLISVVSHPKAFLIENNSVLRKNLQIRKYSGHIWRTVCFEIFSFFIYLYFYNYQIKRNKSIFSKFKRKEKKVQNKVDTICC